MIKSNFPDWLILIENWVKPGGNGYSLPFLIGARALRKQMNSVQDVDIKQLLDEIFNHPIENYVIQITLCANLGVPVFGLNIEPIPGKLFYSQINGLPSAFVRQDLLDTWGSTADEIMSSLFNESRQPVIEGLYSRNFRMEWTKFTDIEVERINRLLLTGNNEKNNSLSKI